MGRGRCPKCKTVHSLTVDEKNKRMIVMPWGEYKKKLEDKQRQDKAIQLAYEAIEKGEIK